MNWLDNVISFISPEAGYRRAAFRNAMAYDAGSFDRLNAAWSAFNDSAERMDGASRDIVRARARDLERNSDIMNSVTSSFRRNVFGAGYFLRARTENEELNQLLERSWKRWCKKQNCDITGMQSFNQMMRMAVNRKKIDGGILFVKLYTKDTFVPFKLQAIEVDELDSALSLNAPKGEKIVNGIRYNEYNKPIGYYIRQYSPDGFTQVQPVYVPAKNVIFYMTKRRPSQLREMSDMAPTITRIRDINEFMTAVSVKERIEACLSVFIKKSLPPSGIGRSSEGKAENHDYNGKMLTPGMIREMNPGDSVDIVNPSGQSTDATSFTKLQQRLVGSGQGLSYETTSRDMSETNYSSARQGMIEDELTYQEDVELLMEIMDEIYETFVISCYLAGIIDIADFWQNKERYLSHEWIKAPKKWIDPIKESNANKVALETGQKTYLQICAENGKDYREQIDEMALAAEYAASKGITIGGAKNAASEGT